MQMLQIKLTVDAWILKNQEIVLLESVVPILEFSFHPVVVDRVRK